MARYHINPESGNAGVCRATTSCPFGDMASDHYGSAQEAQAAFERSMASSLSAPLSKKKAPVLSPPARVPQQPEAYYGEEIPSLTTLSGKSMNIDNMIAGGREFFGEYSPTERAALNAYSSGETFFAMREAYERGEPYPGAEAPDLNGTLASALKKSQLTHPTTLYRSLKMDKGWANGLTSGSEIPHTFFVSTTTDAGKAKAFGAGSARGKEKVILKILAPAGSSAAPGGSGLDEVVLPPSAKFTVRRVTELSGQKLVVVDLLPEE